MLFIFILGVILAIFAVGVVVKARSLSESESNQVRVSRYNNETEPRFSTGQYRFAGIGMFLLAMSFIAMSCFTITDARSVGVKTRFNKESGTVGSGLSPKEPWENVEEWTTRNQVVRFEKGGKDDDEDDNFHTYGCVTVRLGNQSDACIEATVTFAITEKSVVGLWRQHKTFRSAVKEFVVPQAKTAVDFTFSGWNPIAGIDKGIENVETRTNEAWSKLLKPKVGEMYQARSVQLVDAQVTFVHLDDATRAQLNQISAQQGATQVAKEKIKTAEAEADALAKRKAAASSCVDLYLYLAATDQLKNVNAGFNCGAPSGTLVNGGPR